MSYPIQSTFADLTHTGQLIATNTFPLGISYVAAYAQQELGEAIDCNVFRYPRDLSTYLEKNIPQIACFSAFSWNIRLGHEYARRIKSLSPETITVFGGPNFPSAKDEQQEFLTKYPAIDCFIEFEGEMPFVELFRTLETVDFHWNEYKEFRLTTSNIRYMRNHEIIVGDLTTKVKSLNDLPSPYLTGISDKFFNDTLIPMIQTTRGCPYSCTFCWEGGDYFQKTTRFDTDRIAGELNYIAHRVKQLPDLIITDANFGMFKQDIETAQEIANIKKRHHNNWPQAIMTSTAKNHKERTIEIIEIIGDTFAARAAVQSTDNEVLGHIKRKNVSLDALIAFAEHAAKENGETEADVILCLEGDSKRAHTQSINDMLDANMSIMSMFQFILLPGTQSSSKATREKYQMQTRHRVLPRCFGTYEVRGQTFSIAEIEEVVVANNTMSYTDYQDCRDLHLTVEIFNNGAILAELLTFLRSRQIVRSEFFNALHEYLQQDDGVLSQLYSQFRGEEEQNLWKSLEDLESFVQEPGVIDRHVGGEFGTNELRKYRTLAFFNHIDEIHEVAFNIGRLLLSNKGHHDDETDHYLADLRKFSLLRKRDILSPNQTKREHFHFDFLKLMDNQFNIDPFETRCPDGIWLEFFHSEQQRELANGFTKQYGTDLIGLGMLIIRAHINRIFFDVRYSEPVNV